jgi:bacillithiol biosynthesis cysteine-adding enzyme BshC
MNNQFEVESYSFRESGFFSNLMCDYLEQKESLKHLVDGFPSFDSILSKAASRQTLPLERDVLVASIQKQYETQGLLNDRVAQQLSLLSKNNSFTVTTGHQLNIFGGPLYVIYKIIDVLKLAQELTSQSKGKHFIPVFWMASEDHDFDEIANCKVNGEEILWETHQSGAVGRMHLQEFSSVLEQYKNLLGLGVDTAELQQLFQKAYSKKHTLAQATRYWVATLFKDSNLLIIDGDDVSLKALFTPVIKKELEESLVEKSISPTNTFLKDNYHVQVNPRAINLFYLDDSIRDRIERTETGFALVGKVKAWTKDELLEELQNHPERFSPNALMRPMYQECILPNISYTGGGGELAYWLQLKASFNAFNISFPILLMRNSWQFTDQKVFDRLSKTGVSGINFFQDRTEWEQEFISKIHGEQLQLDQEKVSYQDLITSMKSIASGWDAGMENALDAEQARIQGSFKRLEKKLKAAAKRKSKEEIEYYHRWMDRLFDPSGLQERNESLASMYGIHGANWLKYLLDNTHPVQTKFHLVKVKSN